MSMSVTLARSQVWPLCCVGVFQVLVVKSKEAVSRLRDTAMKNKCPVPSMMAQTFIQVNPAFCCLATIPKLPCNCASYCSRVVHAI